MAVLILAFLLGIDTGGTYTDAVLFDEATQKVVASAKSLTTKHDLSIGIGAAVEGVLPSGDSRSREVALASLSTTLATNAVVEGQGAPAGLILIGYGRDALERAGLGAALKTDPVAFIAGGHDALGEERQSLDLAAARQALLDMAPRVAALAVTALFAVRNPSHEVRIRDMARELTGLPVTCGHELTTNLDAPRRALTALLNARLIPQLQHLIEAVQRHLSARAIDAPLMVVKGDGSLMSAEMALSSPVETILSGPAASVVGARALAGAADAVVSDIGGTTTDVAVLHAGLPLLDREGATVGGWRTMVEAVSVHTFGLGGDSEVRLADGDARARHSFLVGPRRVVPLSLLALQSPDVLERLRVQAARERLLDHDGRFGLRLRERGAGALTASELKLWEALAEGPVEIDVLCTSPAMQRPFQRLVDRGLAVVGAFSPSDAAHVLGLQDSWSREAAQLGAELLARRMKVRKDERMLDAEEVSRRVVERVVVQSGQAILAAAFAEESTQKKVPFEMPSPEVLERALTGSRDDDLIDFRVALKRPIVGIGAPAATYYHEIARRLNTELCVPEAADVCNAVGAVAAGIMQSVRILVTAPQENRYRVHLPNGPRDFPTLQQAEANARGEASRLAAEQAAAAGAATSKVSIRRAERAADMGSGERIFVDLEITATAVGRPRLPV